MSRTPNDIQNGRSGTTYAYNDPLQRLTETDFPDGGQTTISYDDTARTVTTTKKVSSGVNMTTVSVMDGMGHVTQTQLTTDPEGIDYSDITYTGLGQAWTKSNPYRGSSTNDKTTYTYDALGRVRQVLQSDNSVVGTDFSGNCATVTDEAGQQRRSCSDALGRLVRVEEPGTTGAPATAGSGSSTLSGSEQSAQVLVTPAASGTGSLQIGGAVRRSGSQLQTPRPAALLASRLAAPSSNILSESSQAPERSPFPALNRYFLLPMPRAQ
jgi:hypothetical protein